MIKLRIYLTEKTTELNKYLLDHLVKIENKVCKIVKAIMIKFFFQLVSQSLDWDWKTQEQVLGVGLNKLPNKQLVCNTLIIIIIVEIPS